MADGPAEDGGVEFLEPDFPFYIHFVVGADAGQITLAEEDYAEDGDGGKGYGGGG